MVNLNESLRNIHLFILQTTPNNVNPVANDVISVSNDVSLTLEPRDDVCLSLGINIQDLERDQAELDRMSAELDRFNPNHGDDNEDGSQEEDDGACHSETGQIKELDKQTLKKKIYRMKKQAEKTRRFRIKQSMKNKHNIHLLRQAIKVIHNHEKTIKDILSLKPNYAWLK